MFLGLSPYFLATTIGSELHDKTKGFISKTVSNTVSVVASVSSTMKGAVSKTASYAYEKAKNNYPNAVARSEKFSESTLGKKIASGIVAFSKEFAGGKFGGTYPALTFAILTGINVAKTSNAQKEGTTEHRRWIIGFVAGLSVIALLTAITSLIGDSTSGAVAYNFLITNLGTIAGGMVVLGIKPTMPKNVSDSYPVRTALCLVTQEGIQAIRFATPVPGATVTGILGGTFQTLAGSVAFYAPEFTKLTKFAIQSCCCQPSSKNFCDPGVLLKARLEKSYRSTRIFNYEMAQKVNFIPFAAQFVEGMLGRIIDQKVGTNVLVRTFNEYTQLIQHPDIQEATRALKNCSPEDTTQRKILQQRLIDCIYKKISAQFGLTERAMACAFQIKTNPKVYEYVNWLVDQIQEKEIEMIGFELSDRQKSKELLEVHAVSYLTLALIQMMRALPRDVENVNLTDAELRKFYNNLIQLSPYSETTVGQAFQSLASAVIPLALQFPALPKKALGLDRETPTIEEVSEENIQVATNRDAIPNVGEAQELVDSPQITAAELSPFFQCFPFLLETKALFTLVWDNIASAFTFKGRKKKAARITVPNPELSYSTEVKAKRGITAVIKGPFSKSLPIQMAADPNKDISESIRDVAAPSA